MMKFIPFLKKQPLVSVIRVEGIIQPGSRARPNLVSDTTYAKLIEKAFKNGKPQAVALVINCPGGSPVQSSLIGSRLKLAAQEAKIPTYAFVEDLAASGGYWIAAAANKIYADPCSIVGSIGVISGSFGFHELLSKTGIERRLYTAGEEKSLLDPFLPQRDEDVARIKEIQEQLHREFIDHVKECRGPALKGDDLFTGRFWLGAKAKELGLIDGIGHLIPEMRIKFGDKVKFRYYGPKAKLWSNLGLQLADAAISNVEERHLRTRFGC